MSAIRVEVTAEHVGQAGPWPKPPKGTTLEDGAAWYPTGWRSPVELAIAARAGVDADVDGDDDGWHATIGTMESSTLFVDLPDAVAERLNAYYAQDGSSMEPFEFDIELDDWIVALVARAASIEDQAAAVIATEPAVDIEALDYLSDDE